MSRDAELIRFGLDVAGDEGWGAYEKSLVALARLVAVREAAAQVEEVVGDFLHLGVLPKREELYAIHEHLRNKLAATEPEANE